MKTELFCCSKYKNSAKPGDDTYVSIPGAVTGIFDGASDPLGTIIAGEPAGLFAARTVAEACASLFIDPAARQMPGNEILGALSTALDDAINGTGYAVRPSTTLALILNNDTTIRLLILGDTGARLNGEKILHSNKTIDRVSTTARVKIFRLLRDRLKNLDLCEKQTRRAIFVGLETAVTEHSISQIEAETVINRTILETDFIDHADAVAEFLWGGIKVQQRFANDPDHPLGFASMNGHPPILNDIIDESFPISDVNSIELFTDGYFSIPTCNNIRAWEQEHARIEKLDFHKIEQYSTVKGSMSDEFSDDRTILIQRY